MITLNSDAPATPPKPSDEIAALCERIERGHLVLHDHEVKLLAREVMRLRELLRECRDVIDKYVNHDSLNMTIKIALWAHFKGIVARIDAAIGEGK